MGCDCGSSRPGTARNKPVVLGAPGGPVVQVRVVQPFAGLRSGLAWVTGSDVGIWMSRGFIRPAT